MALVDELESEVKKIFSTEFSERDGRKVPEPEDILLGNDAVKLNATILYADINGSTKLVDGYKWWFAAMVYKSFLHCCCKVIQSNGGEIVAFDGDRVMAVYIAENKNTSAARTALQINFLRLMIDRKMLERYPQTKFRLHHCVGVDTSEIRAVRTGIRNNNDLVWVGQSANHAAKLTEEGDKSYMSFITEEVYSALNGSLKVQNGKNLWERYSSNTLGKSVYRSSWTWQVS
jgi:class 3 adenylate cyclase